MKHSAKTLVILIALSFYQISHADITTKHSHNDILQAAHQGCIHGNYAQIPLDSKQLNTLVAGKISFSNNDKLHGMTLDFHQDKVKRVIFNNKVNEQSFLLWHAHTNDRLILDAPTGSQACYTLSLTYNHTVQDDADYHNDKPQSPLLQQVQQDPTAQNLASFWQNVAKNGTPLIEQVGDKTLMTFLWRESEPTVNVRLLGSPSNDHEWLYKLPKSDIWYKSFWVKDSLLLSYEFAPNVPMLAPNPAISADDIRYKKRQAMLAKLTHDPLNPHRFGNGSWVGVNAAFSQTEAHQGKLVERIFKSELLNNQRRIWLYQTNNVKKDSQPIVLYLFDGDVYLNVVGVPSLLDDFATRTGIGVIAVLIDNVNRHAELPMNDEFARMMCDELVPFVMQETDISTSANRTVISGSSYGGLAAAFVAYRHPDIFGNVLPLSGSFWYKNGQDQHLYDLVQQNPAKHTQKWHIMAGSYETHRQGETVNDGILGSSQTLAASLNKQGNQATFRLYEGGHDYAVWRVALIDGLEKLFAR